MRKQLDQSRQSDTVTDTLHVRAAQSLAQREAPNEDGCAPVDGLYLLLCKIYIAATHLALKCVGGVVTVATRREDKPMLRHALEEASGAQSAVDLRGDEDLLVAPPLKDLAQALRERVRATSNK